MSAVRRRHAAEPAVSPLQSVRQVPVTLSPIPWGKPDPLLGRMLCRHIADVTPSVQIPCNPFTESKTRRSLRSLHVFHY
jgi:hypothetical protein